jgi:hypothetical protein
MPPKKVIEPDLVSESEYGNVPLEQAIRDCVRDLQGALNNLEHGLITIVDHDEINHGEYGTVFSLSNELIDLAKELKDIVKSFSPSGFKPALCAEQLAELGK